ncbi:hypothetical protein [Kitasatospora sp. Root107]|uniref:hypothetical protein n=1 Tax=Kitasatospora sp. Root107 TaxID=1736424 RepID=UPI00070A1285|nr:hypothetical protein [Kitasatospora sp. Root107]KQV12661.1 hypothetical protein ASC99_33975 [Kitasatospora sp. Root107]
MIRRASTLTLAVALSGAALLAGGAPATAAGGTVTCDVAAMSVRAAHLRAQGRYAEAQAVEQRIRACEDAENDNSGPLWH